MTTQIINNVIKEYVAEFIGEDLISQAEQELIIEEQCELYANASNLVYTDKVLLC